MKIYDKDEKPLYTIDLGQVSGNDIFILDSQYVFCSYGFTSGKKFLFMLDKLTGKVPRQLPTMVRYSPSAMPSVTTFS